jgi:hypothetical protein
MKMKMIRYSAAFVAALFVLSPLAWVASGFQPSPSFNPCQRETATKMTSTKTTPEVMISRRLVLDTSVVGGIVAAASLVANPPPADAVCCHNKRLSTLRDKRIQQQQQQQLRQFQLLGRRRDIIQVGSSSSVHRRGIASAIMSPTCAGE